MTRQIVSHHQSEIAVSREREIIALHAVFLRPLHPPTNAPKNDARYDADVLPVESMFQDTRPESAGQRNLRRHQPKENVIQTTIPKVDVPKTVVLDPHRRSLGGFLPAVSCPRGTANLLDDL